MCGLHLSNFLHFLLLPLDDLRPTHFLSPSLIHLSASESWSRSKGRCSLIGQQSTPSSLPLLPSAPLLSRQQKPTGQHQPPLAFGQVSSALLPEIRATVQALNEPFKKSMGDIYRMTRNRSSRTFPCEELNRKMNHVFQSILEKVFYCSSSFEMIWICKEKIMSEGCVLLKSCCCYTTA